MDALGSHVGLFHAAGICPLRGGLYGLSDKTDSGSGIIGDAPQISAGRTCP